MFGILFELVTMEFFLTFSHFLSIIENVKRIIFLFYPPPLSINREKTVNSCFKNNKLNMCANVRCL